MCFSSYHLGSLGFYRDLVAAKLGEAGTVPDSERIDASASDAVQRHSGNGLFSDVHIASSCLQKALRRGDAGFALGAARMLLHSDEERLWRRLCVIAFEDFGLADLSVTARVVAVAGSKAFRVVHGQERVLAHLIGLLCATPKDRRLDDLYAVAATQLVGRGISNANTTGNEPAASVVGPLVHEAFRLIATCERAVPRRSFRSLSPDACDRALSAFARRGLADGPLIELCAKGVRLSKCLLPILLPLAIEATEASGGLGEAVEQDLLPVPLVGGVPAYAIDGFTRGGRAVLARLGHEEPRFKQLLGPLPAAARLDVLHHLLFFAEGGRCNPLIGDNLSQALYDQAIACGARLPLQAARDAIALMGELLPAVHALRAAVLQVRPATAIPSSTRVPAPTPGPADTNLTTEEDLS